ncbi:unnamed protein product [Tetraodon nigroviridis]|uniref:(spotted green pufferfish) hypothetical protein n=1 Tax=Tetraodon nigroviridis TaxID=99883 RepID=Q4S2H5_TETNG|nr:unnamed protein product [Tetraodon nigroviridis]
MVKGKHARMVAHMLTSHFSPERGDRQVHLLVKPGELITLPSVSSVNFKAMQGEGVGEHWPGQQRSGATPTSLSSALTSPLRQRGGQGRLEEYVWGVEFLAHNFQNVVQDPAAMFAASSQPGGVVWPTVKQGIPHRTPLGCS